VTGMGKQDKSSESARLVAILRGLLAQPSGNEDDPYSRVILSLDKTAGKTKSGLCRLKEPAPSSTDDQLKKKLQAALDSYFKEHGSRPDAVVVDEVGVFRVKSGEVSAEHPLRNKVAVVTGAAGAIGAGICRGLLQKGCRVAASDVVKDKLDALVDELKAFGADRIIGVAIDVTDRDSVARGFAEITLEWGGIDIVVVNAGIAMVASLMEMDPDAFRRLEKVNVEGTLLTIAETGRCLCRQGIGGDIVLVSSKNVFAPGAQFGAYSATKAASHQLARIASLELAPFGIRVNMVSPDAVFSDGDRRSGLWATVGPSRMKARGLDEKGLEDYYRNRNLLKARVTATHVANAVLFFVTRQTPTTGATIPIDGGVPEATPR